MSQTFQKRGPMTFGRTAPVTVEVDPATWERPFRGPVDAPIWVVAEPQDVRALNGGLPVSADDLRWLANQLAGYDFGNTTLRFVGLCPPIPDKAQTATQKWKIVDPHVQSLRDLLFGREATPATADQPARPAMPPCPAKLIVTMGDLASRAVFGRAVKITKARGTLTVQEGKPHLFPIYGIRHVRARPEKQPEFTADWATLEKLRKSGFDPASVAKDEVHYEWRSDLSDFLANKPKFIAVDSETTGLVWWKREVVPLTVQFAYGVGKAVAVPVHPYYWSKVFPNLSDSDREHVVAQLRQILADPAIRKIGHNLKFDSQILRKAGLEVKGWTHDTQLMCFFADENLCDTGYPLSDMTRMWAPEIGGYSDHFDRVTDKSRMIDVPPDDILGVDENGDEVIVTPGMLRYGCGDVDATYRIAIATMKQLKADPQQWRCYRAIQFPALLSFDSIVEKHGMRINRQRLRDFRQTMEEFARVEGRALIRMVPAAVRRKHLDLNGIDGLDFGKPTFRRDVLFSKEGFGLKPVVFTPGGDPSTSVKQHLPYFTDRTDAAGAFCRKMIEFSQAEKMLNTYIGSEEEGTGFFQYIGPDECIYPSYSLHRTNTGRTASENPNGQNFPKRSRFANDYSKMFVARPGYTLVSADLSQIELRIAAWMAMDPTMLAIYAADGDIHTATAKLVAGISDAQWEAMSPKERKSFRTKAKACNFGFLYGMSWRKFKSFAKTDYGVDYTDDEAEEARVRFFQTYNRLPAWHDAQRRFVREHGYVRALHGAKRNLPGIYSTDDMLRSLAERQSINAPVQRFGSDLGLIALARWSMQCPEDEARILGFIHDALVMEVRVGREVEMAAGLKWCMETPPLEDWFGLESPVPIKSEVDIGPDGVSMLEMADLPKPEKRPEWFNSLGIPVLEQDGKFIAQVVSEKPSWWRDDEDEVRKQFLYLSD